jgi:hypothetical protein
VLDYGTGTGLAAIELLKACRERRIEHRLEESEASLELHLADLPGSWLGQGFTLLSGCAWTRFHSLRDMDGRFRPLLDVTGGHTMDVVMANMVFHLIPPPALERVAAELATVIVPGGHLLWNSPDLGPPGEYATLFHDPNRVLRARWLELFAAGTTPDRVGSPASTSQPEAIERAAALDAEARREAQERADRRILPQAHSADDVAAALGGHFDGSVELRTYEMLNEEIVDALLVPSNQAEYLPEITDRALREEVIRDLMRNDVLPTMQQSPAGTALGLNVQWTLGDFTRTATGAG